MVNPVLIETTRGPITENLHRAAAVIASASGAIVEAWGDVECAILPRSSSKLIQALPLIESGAAKVVGLGAEQLALACASHQGAAIHTDRVSAWLKQIGLNEDDLRCGPQPPRDAEVKARDRTATRILNNCSGKHSGFLTLAKHISTDPGGYLEPMGSVQTMVAQAFAEVTETEQPMQYGIDGCSAPNFAASLTGLARGMALFADPSHFSGAREAAARTLVDAIRAHPLLMSGAGRACAAMIEASGRRVAVKTGADGVYVGIDPETGMGFCLKVDDGNTLAAETLCAALLVRIGALAADHPVHARWSEIRNFNNELVGQRRVMLDD